jgi:hypothetical protein
VSPEYAKALESVVPSGSLTGGAVAKARRFAGHFQDILQSVTESRHHFGEVAGEFAQAIRDHLPEVIGITAGFLTLEAGSMFEAHEQRSRRTLRLGPPPDEVVAHGDQVRRVGEPRWSPTRERSAGTGISDSP